MVKTNAPDGFNDVSSVAAVTKRFFTNTARPVRDLEVYCDPCFGSHDPDSYTMMTVAEFFRLRKELLELDCDAASGTMTGVTEHGAGVGEKRRRGDDEEEHAGSDTATAAEASAAAGAGPEPKRAKVRGRKRGGKQQQLGNNDARGAIRRYTARA